MSLGVEPLSSKKQDSDGKKRNEDLERKMNEDFSTDGSDIEYEGTQQEADNGEAVVEELKKADKEASANEDNAKQELLYLKAEFDNFRKRAIKERSDLIKYGPERLAVEILNVMDIFDMALNQEVTSENIDSFKQGMEMTHNQLVSSLKKFGIEEVNPLGQAFDPNAHEALSNEPTNKYPEGHVSQVFKKGYKFYDKLIRPAQVVVAVPPMEETADNSDQ